MPPARSRRLLSALLAATAALLGGQLAVLTPQAAQAAPPVTPSTRVLPLAAASAAELARSGDLPARLGVGALSQPVSIGEGVLVVGMTWQGTRPDAATRLQVRASSGGSWGAWEDLVVGDDHGPDPSTAEAAAARAGTDPYVVLGDTVEFRALGASRLPTGLAALVSDPGHRDGDAGIGVGAGAAQAAALRPTIYTRAQWGADETLRKNPPVYTQTHVGFVHHTAGSNAYTADQVPAIIRGIYAYHVQGQGWNDIGYTALVDRFGRIWEGRYGGQDRSVSGAHTYARNAWSFGISAIGSFDTVSPPSAVVNSLEAYIAWKLTIHGVPPTGTVVINGATHNRISGHRDAYSTSCPGSRLYALLPTIRTDVARRMGVLTPSALRRSVDRGLTNDLLLDESASGGGVSLLRGAPLQAVTSGGIVSTAMSSVDIVAASPDLNGDGRPDLVARDPAGDGLRIYFGASGGGVTGGALRGAGWRGVRLLVPAGDRTGDGLADLLAVTSDGALRLYPGDGAGWIGAGQVLATGMTDLRSLTRSEDGNGDGVPDLLAIRPSDGALLRILSTPEGGVTAARAIATGWGSRPAVVGAGDLDGDGEGNDLVAQLPTGRLLSAYAVKGSLFARMTQWGSGWDRMSSLSSGVDWNGDGRTDLLARRSDGAVVWYSGTGVRDFLPEPVPLALDLAGVTLVRALGDIDADGASELVLRTTDGVLWTAWSADLSRRTRVGAGWQGMVSVEPAGDLTNDGIPDLLGRTSTGALVIYAFGRSGTVVWSIPVDGDWSVRTSILGTGATNADASADAVSFRASDGSVFFHRGSGAGSLLAGDEVLALAAPQGTVALAGLGDLTGDGLSDLVTTRSDGTLWLSPGIGDGRFSTRAEPLRAPVMPAPLH